MVNNEAPEMYEGNLSTCKNCMCSIRVTDWIGTGTLYWVHYDPSSGLLRTRDCYPTTQAVPLY